MSEDLPGNFNYRLIVSQLPQRLQRRFESLGPWIRGVVDEENSKFDANVNLSEDDIRYIQVAALLYLLDSFFRGGSAAAREAAITFERFGHRGFRIGSSTFTRGSRETRRGELLAERLQDSIRDTHLGYVIRESGTVRGLVSTMIRDMNDA